MLLDFKSLVDSYTLVGDGESKDWVETNVFVGGIQGTVDFQWILLAERYPEEDGTESVGNETLCHLSKTVLFLCVK